VCPRTRRPSRGLLGNLEGRELANRCERHLQELVWVAEAGADRVRADRHLLSGSFAAPAYTCERPVNSLRETL